MVGKLAGKLGRNPFSKKSSKGEKPTKAVASEVVQTRESARGTKARRAREKARAKGGAAAVKWLVVDLPAEAYVLGLKAFLLVKETFQKKKR